MQTDATEIADSRLRLVPFIALSLLLHAALLFYVRPSAPPRPTPMTVYLSVAKVPPAAMPIKHRAAASAKSGHTRILTSIKPKTATFAVQPVEQTQPIRPVQPVRPGDSSKSIDTLLESAKNIARDDAIKDEQHMLADQNLNTPIAAMKRELKQPQKEIRLANGILKIITAAGEVCFQPPPLFARDQKGLYGIPMTCP